MAAARFYLNGNRCLMKDSSFVNHIFLIQNYENDSPAVIDDIVSPWCHLSLDA